jgi:hypothetical protein
VKKEKYRLETLGEQKLQEPATSALFFRPDAAENLLEIIGIDDNLPEQQFAVIAPDWNGVIRM